jgi:energy-converting hydrogenase Eha subunit A
MNKIMKPLVAAAIPLLTAGGSYLITGEVKDSAEVWLGATGLFMALVVVAATFFLPDDSDKVLIQFFLTWRKAIAAAVAPLLSAGIQYLVSGTTITRAQVVTAVVGLLTAALMAYVQNAPDS